MCDRRLDNKYKSSRLGKFQRHRMQANFNRDLAEFAQDSGPSRWQNAGPKNGFKKKGPKMKAPPGTDSACPEAPSFWVSF